MPPPPSAPEEAPPSGSTQGGGGIGGGSCTSGGGPSSSSGGGGATTTTTTNGGGGGACVGGLQPSVLFLLGTLGLTSCATAMLWAAIMTDHWEYVTWNHTKVEEIARTSTRNLSHHRIVLEFNFTYKKILAIQVEEKIAQSMLKNFQPTRNSLVSS